MKVKFRGVVYRIKLAKIKKADGFAFATSPAKKRPKLVFDKKRCFNGDQKFALEILIHEALHACHWDMCEKAVDETARNLSRFLIRMGASFKLK